MRTLMTLGFIFENFANSKKKRNICDFNKLSLKK